jgi:RNA polymerase sigma factor (sigma-70 family)
MNKRQGTQNEHGFSVDLKRLREDDQAIWRETFEKLFPVGYRVGRREGLSEADAKEVAQVALIEIAKPGFLEKIETCQDLENIFKAIAWRRSVDLYRRKKTSKRGSGRVGSLDAIVEEGRGDFVEYLFAGDFREQVEIAELMDFLRQVVEKDLNGKERGILFDRYTLGLMIREIAEKRGVAKGSVGVMLDRITKKVIKGLRERGWESLDNEEFAA